MGGGAAGMACAAFCAQFLTEPCAEGSAPQDAHAAQISLFEKNEKLGKKLYITGKGRCNFTNDCDPDDFLSHVVSNPRFLYSAFASFNNRDAIRWFESLGVRTKVERGMRAFPVSDHASDIIRAMERVIIEKGVEVFRNARVETILLDEGPDGKMCACGVRLADGTEYFADAVVVATGGLSYETTGSTGDGYRFAEQLGLRVTETRPSLVALRAAIAPAQPAAVCDAEGKRAVGAVQQVIRAGQLEGLSLKNVRLTIRYGKNGKKTFSEFGEMLFTRDGISGPLVLTASAYLAPFLSIPHNPPEQERAAISGSGRRGTESCKESAPCALLAEIDLKPALTAEQLDARLLREFDAAKNRAVKNVLASLLPAKLRPVFPVVAGIDADRPVHAVTKQEREAMIRTCKAFPLVITGTDGYKGAVITQGGVSVKEIDPKTMESKKIRALYFVGEVLDLDALTGGFNLQIAWTTAYAAAEAICGSER